MARIKRGTTTRAKHKNILEQAKGYRGRRKNTIRVARQAVEKAGQYAYRDRKAKYILQIFVGRFRENSVFLDTNGEVAHLIHGGFSNTAEVARARKRNVDELVNELVHTLASERRLETDDFPFTELELRD